MKRQHLAAIGLLSASLLAASFTAMQNATAQKQLIVGVSWYNFQEERWKIDEAGIKGALDKSGAAYVAADAQSSSEKQLNDIDSLIAKGANAIVILAGDAVAIKPAIAKAKAAKIPVIGYDRLIEDPSAFYLTFDNVEVGRIMARVVQKVKPTGNYAFIRGNPGDPNANFVYGGQKEILQKAIDSGAIKVVGEQSTEGWKPDVAQKNMEGILTQNGNKIDAVMSSNDGMAGGVVAALTAVGLAGKVAVSGQDGDLSALNRVALGTQTVSVWKDAGALGKAAGEIAVQLAKGTPMNKVKGSKIFKDGPEKASMNSVLLKPIGITKSNLKVVLNAGWISKQVLCQGVDPNKVAVCK
jgi:D-xylose transport system substrate-binding protein